MGVPVVALRGDRFVSRVAATLLTHAGYPEWVAESEDEYVAKALSLGREPGRLAAIRREQRARVAASPLADAVRFTRSLEDVYRRVWREWCASA
jgi:predicted O-linked N-acetylglucosamine transferase (SPINDLY family)